VQVGGQAFTAYPPAMERVEASFVRHSALAATGSTRGSTRGSIRVTAFGKRVQDYAAAAVSLGPIYADPVGTMRKIGAGA